MARLPNPGGDDNLWGDLLNEYLLVSHTAGGELKQQSIIDAGAYVLPSNGIPKSSLDVSVQNTLTKADTALQAAPVSSVAGRTGAITVTKSDVGLANVDNTSDLDKPVSTQTQLALNTKASQVHTHAIADVTDLQSTLDAKLSTSDLDDYVTSNDLTAALGDYATNADMSAGLATKLDATALSDYATNDSLSSGLSAKANVSHTHTISEVTGLQSALDTKVDTSSLSEYATTSDLTATLGDYATTADVTAGLSTKADTSSLSAVATSGSYNDLADKPTIPKITVSSIAPSSPSVGDLWVDLGS